jgi:uncharacterized protein YraI
MRTFLSAALVAGSVFTGASVILPVSAVIVPFSANAQGQGVTRTTRHLNIRRGPGTKYRRVAVVPPGRVVNVKGCTGNWCAITWRRHRGYVYAGYLSTHKTTITSPTAQ